MEKRLRGVRENGRLRGLARRLLSCSFGVLGLKKSFFVVGCYGIFKTLQCKMVIAGLFNTVIYFVTSFFIS